jgi:hypothetical protein
VDEGEDRVLWGKRRSFASLKGNNGLQIPLFASLKEDNSPELVWARGFAATRSV